MNDVVWSGSHLEGYIIHPTVAMFGDGYIWVWHRLTDPALHWPCRHLNWEALTFVNIKPLNKELHKEVEAVSSIFHTCMHACTYLTSHVSRFSFWNQTASAQSSRALIVVSIYEKGLCHDVNLASIFKLWQLIQPLSQRLSSLSLFVVLCSTTWHDTSLFTYHSWAAMWVRVT